MELPRCEGAGSKSSFISRDSISRGEEHDYGCLMTFFLFPRLPIPPREDQYRYSREVRFPRVTTLHGKDHQTYNVVKSVMTLDKLSIRVSAVERPQDASRKDLTERKASSLGGEREELAAPRTAEEGPARKINR